MSDVNDKGSGTKDQEGIFRRIEQHVQGKTMSGLLALVPVLVTAIVIYFIIDKADAFLRPMLANIEITVGAGPDSGADRTIRPLDFAGVGIIAAVLVFYFLGLLVSAGLGLKVMDWIGVALRRIPVVRVVYGVTEQATAALTSKYNFSRVVFLEWPREGMVAVGFVTGRMYSRERDMSLVVVYVPTVPNPTSGNMAFVDEDDVIETDLTVEYAMKLVFSGGIVLPKSMSMARVRDSDIGFTGRFETD